VSGLLAGLVALPLLAGLFLIVAARRVPLIISRGVTLAVVSLVTLCALGLLSHLGSEPAVEIVWLPGMGPMTLGLGATGLYAALGTALAAVLVLLGTPPRKAEPPSLSGAVLLVTLGAANVAFLAQHFLLRYAALEIVALCVALSPLIELRNSHGTRLSRFVYLILRLGDAGLLVAIMILMDASGTLDITSALKAGQALDAKYLGWAVAGFVLAIWVKLGAWPFHLWAQVGQELAPSSHAWLYVTVMPNLGLYLLYRITPLLVLAGPLRGAVLWIGAGSAALAALVALTQLDTRAALAYLGAAQGGLVLFVAASGLEMAVWLSLLVVTLLRLLLYMALDTHVPRRIAAGLLTLGGDSVDGFGLVDHLVGPRSKSPLGCAVCRRGRRRPPRRLDGAGGVAAFLRH